jgi:hypothetical protein
VCKVLLIAPISTLAEKIVQGRNLAQDGIGFAHVTRQPNLTVESKAIPLLMLGAVKVWVRFARDVPS